MYNLLKTFLITISTVIIVISAVSASEKNWKLKKNSNGIKVYTRNVKNIDLDEFRGIGVIDASINNLINIIRDVPNHPNWAANCKKATLIKKNEKNTKRTIYNVTSLPWPLQDRDVVVEVIENNISNSKTILNFKALLKTSIRKNDDYVRITNMIGQWILTSISGEQTLVEYKIKCDPGGSIPKSIANYSSVNIPYNTILGLKNEAIKNK